MLLLTSAVSFFLGAAIGVSMATLRITGRDIPWLMAALHGIFNGIALGGLIVATLTHGGTPWAVTALIVLLWAAAVGAYLVTFHIRQAFQEISGSDERLQHPLPAIIVHATLAITGYVMLLVAILHYNGTGIPGAGTF